MVVETLSDLERLISLARRAGATGESEVKINIADAAPEVDDLYGDEAAGSLVRRMERGIRITFIPRAAVRRGTGR
jgi:hypothetical protein